MSSEEVRRQALQDQAEAAAVEAGKRFDASAVVHSRHEIRTAFTSALAEHVLDLHDDGLCTACVHLRPDAPQPMYLTWDRLDHLRCTTCAEAMPGPSSCTRCGSTLTIYMAGEIQVGPLTIWYALCATCFATDTPAGDK